MKVLTINGSPRKDGNSNVLCGQFLKGAAEAGHGTAEIRLAERKISPCMACYHCMEAGHKCAIRDDMEEILQKMLEADVIVLATPVYFYSLSAQMKMFIDRCLPRYLELKDKEFYFIVTAAEPEHKAADEAIASLRGFRRCLPDAVEKGIIYGTGTWDKGDVYRHPAFEKAYEAGKSI